MSIILDAVIPSKQADSFMQDMENKSCKNTKFSGLKNIIKKQTHTTTTTKMPKCTFPLNKKKHCEMSLMEILKEENQTLSIKATCV